MSELNDRPSRANSDIHRDAVSDSRSRRGGTAFFPALVCALLAGGIVGLATWEQNRTRIAEPKPAPPPVSVGITQPVATAAVQQAAFFDSAVQPAIEVADSRNREAADRCVERLRDVMDGYRAGVYPFVDDLTSLSTRFGIVKRMPGNWWKGDKRIDAFIREKFERHLFSEQQMTSDIVGVLNQFRDEVDSNQRRMLVEVRAALTTADLPDVTIDQYAPFFEGVAKDLMEYSEQSGMASVNNFAAILVASEVGAQVFIRVVGGLLGRFAVSAAIGAAASGGAAAGGSAAGAGAGTLAGPVGTVVGFGIGLAVGVMIDWWMTERFEAQMTSKMNGHLNQVQLAILGESIAGIDVEPNASATTLETDAIDSVSKTDFKEGLIHTLPRVCDSLLQAYRERFYEQIVKIELPRTDPDVAEETSPQLAIE